MAKQTFSSGLFTFNSVAYGVTALSVNKAQSEIDVTNTNSPSGAREYLSTGREEFNVSITLWKDVNAANLELGAERAAELDFEGFTYDGDVLLLTLDDEAAIDEGIEQTYTGRFTGSVTETPAA